MIKRIRVIFRKRAVWSGGETYDVRAASPREKFPLEEGQVVFDKTYPRGTEIHKIWSELRERIMAHFFIIFYPAVIRMTASSRTYRKGYKYLSPVYVTKHIYYKQRRLPEFYEWDERRDKWHMTSEGYMRRTVELGGPMKIGVALPEQVFTGEISDYTLLEELQEMYPSSTQRIVLFIYPDRYDQEIRAMLELEVTFY